MNIFSIGFNYIENNEQSITMTTHYNLETFRESINNWKKVRTGWNVLYNYIEDASPLREGNTVSISMSFWGNECGGNDIGLLTWSTEVRRSMDVWLSYHFNNDDRGVNRDGI